MASKPGEAGVGMEARKNISHTILEKLYVSFIKERQRAAIPRLKGAFPIEFKSYDGVRLVGWGTFPDQSPRGTVFLCHGYTLHSLHTMYPHYAKYLSRKYNLATLAFDFRNHGLSENAPLTFGTAESWDLRAAMDYAERNGFPGPFVVFGDSLGGLAGQRAAIEDSRIAGAVFKSSPAAPWDAIETAFYTLDILSTVRAVMTRNSLPGERLPSINLGWCFKVAHLINQAYGWDILHDGDIRYHNGNPDHKPKILYLIGEEDEFGWKKTKERYDHWYPGTPSTFDVWPADAPNELKWFVLAKGMGHKFGSWDWPGFYPLLDQFFSTILWASNNVEYKSVV